VGHGLGADRRRRPAARARAAAADDRRRRTSSGAWHALDPRPRRRASPDRGDGLPAPRLLGAAARCSSDLLGGARVRIRLWGTRGSVAAPGGDTARFGGNTSCVEVRGDEGTVLVLD